MASTIFPKSHVGFDSITDQIKHKLLKRGFQFNVICVGKSQQRQPPNPNLPSPNSTAATIAIAVSSFVSKLTTVSHLQARPVSASLL
jgi:hypothetical protein